MNPAYDLFGIGIGPFNLSLAALLQKTKDLRFVFMDAKPEFSWHPEIMFEDSVMQTGYMKDLVTPADPTNPYSFLNYLHHNGLFYQFLNTQRSVVTRQEFEKYCQWVSYHLEDHLQFSSPIQSVDFKDGLFQITDSKNTKYQSRHICVATGKKPFIPSLCQPFLGKNIFHAKDPELQHMDLTGQRVAIIGGGQTGVEIFKNALDGKWGAFQSLKLFSRRKNLEPLDETAFTNEYFIPSYMESFWNLNQETKDRVMNSQKLTSDGNTPSYLLDLYRKMYLIKNIQKDSRSIGIFPMRELSDISQHNHSYEVQFHNAFTETIEAQGFDKIILATGFQASLPQVLEPLFPQIELDAKGRFLFHRNYTIKWQGSKMNKIYALNYSRHSHGIADPQTSLMAWRSAQIINDLTQKEIYKDYSLPHSFLNYAHTEDEAETSLYEQSENSYDI